MKVQNLTKSIAEIFPPNQRNPLECSSVTLKILIFLLAGVGVLVIFHLFAIMTFSNPNDLLFLLFFLGYDNNIPAWYSSMLLAIAAFLAFQCSNLARNFGRPDQWAFLLLCALLMLMSCDEIARLHEVVPMRVAKILGIEAPGLFENHRWVLLGGPFVLILLAGIFGILIRVLKRHKPSLILLGLGLASIALGGVVLEAVTVLIPHGPLKQLEILVEECLEMIGTLLICASLVTWRDHTAANSK